MIFYLYTSSVMLPPQLIHRSFFLSWFSIRFPFLFDDKIKCHIPDYTDDNEKKEIIWDEKSYEVTRFYVLKFVMVQRHQGVYLTKTVNRLQIYANEIHKIYSFTLFILSI